MVNQLFATKISMSQAWTKSGKRLAVTRLKVEDNRVIGEKNQERDGYAALQIGYGNKKIKNLSKPLRTQVEKSGFSVGVQKIREVKVTDQAEDMPKVGEVVKLDQVIKVGDIVNVQGVSKGRGFAGGMKRHGFHGGPKTHGQSDRQRSPGSIGAGTTPGRVLKGLKMAGQYGSETKTIKHLQVVFMDAATGEVWLSGPVPGHFNSTVRLSVVDNKEFEGLGAGAKAVTQTETEQPEANDVATETTQEEK